MSEEVKIENNDSVSSNIIPSGADLKQHLEKQFVDGMIWDNYGRGGWVVDHIRPICSFSYSTAEDLQFKECWALENLRLIPAAENLKKSHEDIKLSVRKKKQPIPSGIVEVTQATSNTMEALEEKF